MILIDVPYIRRRANVLEATAIVADIYDTEYDISRFLRYIPTYQSNHQDFRALVHQAPEKYLQVIEEVE